MFGLNHDHPRVQSPIVAGFEDLKVLDLIDPVSGTWDSNLIHGMFIPQEANMIMSIPLCQSFAEDKLIWPFSPSGIYTVKSGSKFLANENELSSALGDSSQSTRVWKIIWELSVPNKVRNFMWCSCRDAIPVKKNIGKAGLGVVIRNSHGQAIASLSEQAPQPYSSDIVKAMAAARAISFAHELGFTSYTIEGDSETVIKALQADDDSLSPFGHILAWPNPQ